MTAVYNEIYKIVQSIPQGRVLTYGVISHMIGGRMSAQGVGWALKALGSAKKRLKETGAKKAEPSVRKRAGNNKAHYDLTTVPWQRVVNAQGGTSTHKIAEIPPGLQQHILEREGIVFDSDGKMDLKKFLWIEGLSQFGREGENHG